MKQHEFLAQLSDALKKAQVPDADEILSEYEQHFAFKLADGYSEEEIAAKLGAPAELAAQFAQGADGASRRGSVALTKIGLGVADFFAAIVFVILAAFGVVLAVFSLCCAVAAVCLIGRLNVASLIPPMPYGCGAVIGIAMLALAVLAGVGCAYYTAFWRQLLRAFGRFQQNTLAAAAGKPALPALAAHPRLPVKTRQRLRTVTMIALVVFAVSFALGFVLSALTAGAFQFWHVWGWFAA